MIARPMPPAVLADLDPEAPLFIPAPEVVEWAHACFIGSGASRRNPDHDHLEDAEIRCLWTNAPARRQMRTIAGTCEIPTPRGTPWVKARQEAQLRDWFGATPINFLITLSAPYSVECGDVEFCALVEHELYHGAQQFDAFGAPKFSRSTGLPLFAIRGHDVEEFVGVVRRYGAAGAGVAEMVEAAGRRPEIGAAAVSQICGTCLARAAA